MENANSLLTQEDIKKIEDIVERNPLLRHPDAMGFFGEEHTTVYKVSPIKGLIFVKGNSETGFEHIHSRHEFWSTTPYWKENDKGENKLDNPSRFGTNSIPIRDYILIGDAIYTPENLNTEKNHSPDKFELYMGDYTPENGAPATYVLLTYKDTKIVHTLFPKTKKNNTKRPDKFNFSRGDISAEETPEQNLLEIKIPYLDSNHRIVYSISIVKHTELNKEQAFIWVHGADGRRENFYYLGDRESIPMKSITHELHQYQYSDLRGFEKIILDISRKS